MAKKKTQRPGIRNRKAYHDYHVDDRLEVGISLLGSEVKSVRMGRVSLAEGYGRIDADSMEMYLHNVDIAMYANAGSGQHEPKRTRKLLAHRREISKLLTQTASKGMTLIPLGMYFNDRGIAKVELGVCRGKGKSDKRESIRAKEADRDIRRAMSRRR